MFVIVADEDVVCGYPSQDESVDTLTVSHASGSCRNLDISERLDLRPTFLYSERANEEREVGDGTDTGSDDAKPGRSACVGRSARRDDTRVARRLYRKQVVDGVYRLDEGALLDDFFSFLQELGVGDWLSDVQGTAVQREMVPLRSVCAAV